MTNKMRGSEENTRPSASPAALSASLEDYLEAVYNLIESKQVARVKDIATELQVNNSSVTGALRILAEKGLIHYSPYEFITLTPAGKELALDITHRHRVLKDFFTRILNIDEELSDKTACKMEHEISPDIIGRLIRYIDFIDKCPRMQIPWSSVPADFCKHMPSDRQESSLDELAAKNCKQCLGDCLKQYEQKEK